MGYRRKRKTKKLLSNILLVLIIVFVVWSYNSMSSVTSETEIAMEKYNTAAKDINPDNEKNIKELQKFMEVAEYSKQFKDFIRSE